MAPSKGEEKEQQESELYWDKKMECFSRAEEGKTRLLSVSDILFWSNTYKNQSRSLHVFSTFAWMLLIQLNNLISKVPFGITIISRR